MCAADPDAGCVGLGDQVAVFVNEVLHGERVADVVDALEQDHVGDARAAKRATVTLSFVTGSLSTRFIRSFGHN